MQDDVIERLRDTMAGQTGGGMTCMDADDARAILAHITALTAERDALAGIVRGWHWLAVGPDEMGDYQHQRELIKASEPYASPALQAIAAGAHKPQIICGQSEESVYG
jgi:hypothetical protein